MKGAVAAGATTLAGRTDAQTARPPANGKFTYDELVKRATALASAPFQGEPPHLPDEINKLDFDAWRQIEYSSKKSFFGAAGGQFQLELFHLGHLFKRPVVINTVRDGVPTPIPYQSSEFNFGGTKFSKPLPVNLGFAGFRIRSFLNSPTKSDEFISFVGASYFRFLGRDQQYGLSARGLAVNGGANQEEFPFYREFWIDVPKPDADKITIYALLDGAATTGAYQFDCFPMVNSVIEVRATLVPRRDDAKLGFAPLTSMFFIGENGPKTKDDYRFELHDSDGLMIQTGSGEWIWRPLRNPDSASTSSFIDRDVRGFGLIQRDRDFSHYEDIDLAYQMRPSYWVQPHTQLGEGHVELFEMPTTDETNDNIVASWVPKDRPVAGKPLSFAYSITAALDLDWLSTQGKTLNTFQTSAHSLGAPGAVSATARRFMIDFNEGDLAFYKGNPSLVKVVASASRGKIIRADAYYNPYVSGFRVTLDIDVPHGETTDMRVFLKERSNTLTETWVFSWESPPGPAPSPGDSAKK